MMLGSFCLCFDLSLETDSQSWQSTFRPPDMGSNPSTTC
jgi:hypothetical protein